MERQIRAKDGVAAAEARGVNATVVMFICNHCPYVKSAIRRIVRDAAELEALGARAIAIMPNDVAVSPMMHLLR
jgi:hypothetical protein